MSRGATARARNALGAQLEPRAARAASAAGAARSVHLARCAQGRRADVRAAGDTQREARAHGVRGRRLASARGAWRMARGAWRSARGVRNTRRIARNARRAHRPPPWAARAATGVAGERGAHRAPLLEKLLAVAFRHLGEVVAHHRGGRLAGGPGGCCCARRSPPKRRAAASPTMSGRRARSAPEHHHGTAWSQKRPRAGRNSARNTPPTLDSLSEAEPDGMPLESAQVSSPRNSVLFRIFSFGETSRTPDTPDFRSRGGPGVS